MDLNTSNIELSYYDQKRNVILPKRLTEDLAYLCGVLAGDGYLSGDEDVKHEYNLVCCGHPIDEREYYYNILCPLFYKVFNIEFNPKFNPDGTIRIQFGSKAIHYLLTKIIGLPTGKKWSSLKIPKTFLDDKKLIISFIKGVFDTDGCVSFKKRYRDYHYYPSIALSSKSESFIKEIAKVLKEIGFKFSRTYHYKVKDKRLKKGFSRISRIDLLGRYNMKLWLKEISFLSPKHLNKIKNNEKWCLKP